MQSSSQPYVLGVFLDFTAAFDKLWWPGVLRNLKELGVAGEGYDILRDYLSGRRVEIRVGGGRVRKDVTLGCPQGSVLGPQLWKITFDTLARRITGLGVGFVAYADDGVIIVEGRSRTDLESRVMKVLDELVEWMSMYKMEASKEKTVLMLLKGSMVRKPDCWLEGSKLRVVDQVRYLGVTWESRWRIVTHIEVVMERAHSLLCKVLRTRKAQTYRAMQLIYNGLYVAIVCYAVAVWFPLIGKVRMAKALSLQRRTLLRLTRGYNTISTEAVPVLAGVLPIDLEMKRRWAAAELKRAGRVQLGGEDIEGGKKKGVLTTHLPFSDLSHLS